ncbi:MAG TPA: repressor LexA [Elusimicrobia bacterium]|nr:repressor LexA [Elusimicrobiota bacterium]
MLNSKELEALKVIRNYFVHFRKVPSVIKLAESLDISSRTANLLLMELVKKNYLIQKQKKAKYLLKEFLPNNVNDKTVDIPIVGSIACGAQTLAQEISGESLQVSQQLLIPGYKYFMLRARGSSMNETGINDGDYVLIKQQAIAKNGDRVVAIINDEATIKEFHREKDFIILKPKSNVPTHKPIILKSDFMVQGIVVAVIPKF